MTDEKTNKFISKLSEKKIDITNILYENIKKRDENVVMNIGFHYNYCTCYPSISKFRRETSIKERQSVDYWIYKKFATMNMHDGILNELNELCESKRGVILIDKLKEIKMEEILDFDIYFLEAISRTNYDTEKIVNHLISVYEGDYEKSHDEYEIFNTKTFDIIKNVKSRSSGSSESSEWIHHIINICKRLTKSDWYRRYDEIFYAILFLSDASESELSVLEKYLKSEKLSDLVNDVDIIEHNKPIFDRYYVRPTQDTNKYDLMLACLKSNKLNILQILAELNLIPTEKTYKFNTFSPFHFADYHKNNEMFEFLKQYYDITFYESTKYLSGFVSMHNYDIDIEVKESEESKTNKYGEKDVKMSELGKNIIVNIGTGPNSDFRFVGLKDNVNHFIFSQFSGCENASLLIHTVEFSSLYPSYVEHVGFGSYNGGMKYAIKYEHDKICIEKLTEHIYVQYLPDNKINFITFNTKSNSYYDKLYYINDESNLKLKLVNNKNSVSTISRNGHEWSSTVSINEKLHWNEFKGNLECDNTVQVTDFGWYKTIDKKIFEGTRVHVPLSVIVDKMIIDSDKIRLVVRLDKDMKFLSNHSVDSNNIYLLTINSERFKISINES